VAAIRQFLFPFSLMAVHVSSTDVKSGAEIDHFVNQQLQIRQPWTLREKFITFQTFRGKKKPNNLEKFIVVYDFYRLTQQLLGKLKQKQVQITQCQFYGTSENGNCHGTPRGCKVYMRQSNRVRGQDKRDIPYTPNLHCCIVLLTSLT
jgi:hypothetical protein